MTCASTAVAEALLIENRVLTPFGLFRSTSKYGSSRVAAGTSSIVSMHGESLAAEAEQAHQGEAESEFLHG